MKYKLLAALTISVALTACGGSSSNNNSLKNNSSALDGSTTVDTPPNQDGVTPPTNEESYIFKPVFSLSFGKHRGEGLSYYRIDDGTWQVQEEGINNVNIDYSSIKQSLDVVSFCKVNEFKINGMVVISKKNIATVNRFDKDTLDAYKQISTDLNYNVGGVAEFCNLYNIELNSEGQIDTDNGVSDTYSHFIKLEFPEGYEVLDGYVYGYYPNGRIQAGTNLEPVVLKSSTVKPSNPLEKPESQLNVLMKSSSGELIEFSTPLNLNTEAYAGLGNTKDKPIVIAVDDGEQLEPEFITQDLEAAYFASNNGSSSSYYNKEDDTYWLPKSNGFATYQFYSDRNNQTVINGTIVKAKSVSLFHKDVDAAKELSDKSHSNRYITPTDYLVKADTLTMAIGLPNGKRIIDDLSFDINKHKARNQNLYNLGTIASLNADIEGRVYSTINYNISSNPNLDAANSSSITLLDVNTLPNLPESYKVNYEQFNTATFTNIQVSIKEAFVNDFLFGDGDMMVEQSLVILEL